VLADRAGETLTIGKPLALSESEAIAEAMDDLGPTRHRNPRARLFEANAKLDVLA